MKIIFYTCGQAPTEEEKKAIAALGPGVCVRNGSIAGRIDKQEDADDYKGSIPAKFAQAPEPVADSEPDSVAETETEPVAEPEVIKPAKKAWGKK